VEKYFEMRRRNSAPKDDEEQNHTQNIEGRLELSDEKTEFTQRLSTA